MPLKKKEDTPTQLQRKFAVKEQVKVKPLGCIGIVMEEKYDSSSAGNMYYIQTANAGFWMFEDQLINP